MRRISISEFCTYRWSFEQDLLRYAALGCNSAGIWRRKVEDFGVSRAIELAYEMKTDVSSLNWVGGFTGSDGRRFDDAVQDAVEAIQLANQLNAGCLVLHPGGRNNHTNKHAFRLINKALSELVPIASDYGVRLAMELIPEPHRSPWTFVHSLADIRRLLHSHAGESLGLVVDLYHVGLHEPTLDWLREQSDRIALVQLADRSIGTGVEEYRQQLGSGDVDLQRWFGLLDDVNYQGPLELELHGVGVEGMDYFDLLDQSLDFLHQHVPANSPSSQPQQVTSRVRAND